VSPLGNSIAETWAAAKAGRSGIGPITRFDAALFSCKFAGEVRNFNPEKYLEVKEVKKQDLFSQFGIAAAQEAWDDSKFEGSAYDRRRVGCILGIGIGGITTFEKYHSAYIEGGPRKISPFLIPAMISNLGPGNIAIRFGLKAVNFTITSACTSATHAIGESYLMIASGRVDAMLTGGSESAVTPVGIGGFCSLKALSTRNDDPQRASRPFDKDRDGFVMGEGSSILVLEEYEAARKRGAKIYAEIVGYGSSCDAYHITAPSEDGSGAIECMKSALEDAGMKPEQIDYVNAHGTSTPANDIAETVAIKQVYGAHAHGGLMVSSTKSMTGHLLGAAGAVEAAFCALGLAEGVVPPTINLDNPDEGCDLDYVPHTARKAPIKTAMSNSFGFGGTNSSIILRKIS
jgi:3-oxoacyl-[acyl-carrier-protein] synthase II